MVRTARNQYDHLDHCLIVHVWERWKNMTNGENNWEPVRPQRPLPENHCEPVRTLFTGNMLWEPVRTLFTGKNHWDPLTMTVKNLHITLLAGSPCFSGSGISGHTGSQFCTIPMGEQSMKHIYILQNHWELVGISENHWRPLRSTKNDCEELVYYR